MNRLSIGGLAFTLFVHAGLVAALVLGQDAKAAHAERNYVVAKLVRLGKPRDERLLPLKDSAPPPTKTPEKISPSVDPNAPVAPTKRPNPEAKVAEDFRDSMLHAKRLGEAVEPEGDPSGSPFGTADEASEGDPYATAIDAAIRSHWSIPDLVRPEQLANLECVIHIRIASSGVIVDQKIVEPSGNRFFDLSVMEALGRVKQLPPPPADRVSVLVGGGITIVFKP